MAKLTNKILLVASFLVLATEASAENVRITCGKQGTLRAIETNAGRTEFEAKVEGPIEAQLEVACQKLGECFSRFPEVQKAAGETARILEKTGFDSDLSPFLDAETFFQGCKKSNVPLGEHAPLPDQIKIRPSLGINRSKRGNYNSDFMKKVVQHALFNGTDPYLALAITILESPVTSVKSEYADNYGIIPVDETAAYTAMGCLPGGKNDTRYLKKAELNKLAELSRRINSLDSIIYSKFFAAEQTGKDKIASYLSAKSSLASISTDLPYVEEMANQVGGRPYWKQRLKEIKTGLTKVKAKLALLENDPLVLEFEKLNAERDTLQSESDAILKAAADRFPNDPGAERFVLTEAKCASDTGCRGVVRQPKESLDLNFILFPESSVRSSHLICVSEKTAGLAGSPDFRSVPEDETKTCCAKVAGSPAESEFQLLKTTLGAKYIKDQIQDCVAKGGKSLAYCIQKYNGLGCFGCTEKVNNGCFYKLQMAKTPVYGARAADLMLDALMDHPDINRMVQAEQQRMGLAPASIFCMEKKKAGTYSFNSTTYAQSLKNMLGGRAACQKYFK